MPRELRKTGGWGGEGRDGDCVEAVVGDVKEEAEDERQEGKKSKWEENENDNVRGDGEWRLFFQNTNQSKFLSV